MLADTYQYPRRDSDTTNYLQKKKITNWVHHQVPETWYHQPSSSPRNICDAFPPTTTTPQEYINQYNAPPPSILILLLCFALWL